MSLSTRLISAVLLLGAAPAALAQFQYSYTGPTFLEPIAPYTSTSRISGSFTLPTALAPNLNNVNIAAQVTAFSFTDGQATRARANSTICDFSVSTNAAGQITGHDIWLRELAPAASSHNLETRGPSSVDLAGFVTPAVTGCGAAALNPFGTVQTPAGNPPWIVLNLTPAVTQIPASGPMTLWLLVGLTGIVGVWSLGRRGG